MSVNVLLLIRDSGKDARDRADNYPRQSLKPKMTLNHIMGITILAIYSAVNGIESVFSDADEGD